MIRAVDGEAMPKSLSAVSKFEVHILYTSSPQGESETHKIEP